METEVYDKVINILSIEKKALIDFVDRELKRIDKYRDIEQQVIYYKEQYISKYPDEVTWYFISRKVRVEEFIKDIENHVI